MPVAETRDAETCLPRRAWSNRRPPEHGLPRHRWPRHRWPRHRWPRHRWPRHGMPRHGMPRSVCRDGRDRTEGRLNTGCLDAGCRDALVETWKVELRKVENWLGRDPAFLGSQRLDFPEHRITETPDHRARTPREVGRGQSASGDHPPSRRIRRRTPRPWSATRPSRPTLRCRRGDRTRDPSSIR